VRAEPETRWPNARRVLCVRLDSIGDVLMSTPAIRAVKETGPGRRVTVLTSPSGAQAARLVPEIDEVIEYRAPWMKATPVRGDGRADLGMIRRLRRRRFDAAVIFTVYSQSPLPAAVLCQLAGIPLAAAHARDKAYHLLTDAVPDPEPDRTIRHEVRRQLDLVATLGFRTDDERLAIRVPRSAARTAGRMLAGMRGEYAVVHPGATAPSRRYPEGSFAGVARALVRDHGWRLVLTGTADEVELVERVRAAADVPAISLAGRLSVAELAAVLERAAVVIAGNTGPVHIAAAVGTPVVDLYALTNPQHTPWGVPNEVLFHDVPCRMCQASVCPMGHHRCLRMVPPSAVVEAALRLSAAPPPWRERLALPLYGSST
jgi:lipopolysaccharide heptosyltransferase II